MPWPHITRAHLDQVLWMGDTRQTIKAVEAQADTSQALTICSNSYFYNDLPHIQANWKLITHLNKDASFRWVLADRNLEELDQSLLPDDERLILLQGDKNPAFKTPNYHHAAGLEKTFATVNTRFLLILDPDFYILKKEWIYAITSYMMAHNLAFMGVPWHPGKPTKYRYFPAVHCMFVDLDQVPLNALDFMPEITERGQGFVRQHRMIGLVRKALGIRRLLKAPAHDCDTGSRIYRRFGREKKYAFELFKPVYRPQIEHLTPARKQIYNLLPDALSAIPKKTGYYTRQGFAERGYTDLSALGWEEFIWQNEIWGFHLRRAKKRQERDAEREAQTLMQVLSAFSN